MKRNDDGCPNCGSWSLSRWAYHFGSGSLDYRCMTCGHQWTEPSPKPATSPKDGGGER